MFYPYLLLCCHKIIDITIKNFNKIFYLLYLFYLFIIFVGDLMSDKKNPITVSLDEQEYKKVCELAKKKDWSIAKAARYYIQKGLSK